MADNYQNRIGNLGSGYINTQPNSAVQNNQNQQQNINQPQENTPEPKGKGVSIPSQTRLNALDSTLLENEAYQDIDDDNFKTEYRINVLEQKIRILDNDIQNAKNINDLQKVDVLTMRKHSLQNELRKLNSDYESSDITTRLSGDITNILNQKPKGLTNVVSKIKGFIGSKILSKISKSFNNNQDVKSALSKLKTLNKNVDELITMQTPYGEADEWYDKLSDYLNTANVIHFQISKTVGTPTFFDTISSIDKQKLNKQRKNSSNFNNMANKPPMM